MGFAKSIAAAPRVSKQLNLEEKSCCRFAADSEIGNRQYNL
jgi:hypothetical protein